MNLLSKKKIFVYYLIGISLIVFFYVRQAVIESEIKNFWIDEQLTLDLNAKPQGFMDLLIHGAKGQPSPSPLYYMLMRVFYVIREGVQSFGLPFNIYYRLGNISLFALSGFIISFLLFKNHTKQSTATRSLIQGGLLALALLSFYSPCDNIYYSLETRPYALWMVLWFSITLLFLNSQRFTPFLIFLMVLLSMNATASIFHWLALGAGFIITRLIEKDSIRSIIIDALKIFSLPVLVSLYYMVGKDLVYGYPEPQKYSDEFIVWWKDRILMAILSLAGIIMSLLTRRYRSHTAIFIAMLILYLASPLINHFVVSRGYFFSHRQYIYYNIIYPVFFAHVAIAWPDYVDFFKNIKGISKLKYIPVGIVLILLLYPIKTMVQYHRKFLFKKVNTYIPTSYEDISLYYSAPVRLNETSLKYYLFYYSLVTRHYPKIPEAYGLMGFFHYQLGNMSQAEICYKKALKKKPQFFWYYYNLAVIYHKQHRFKEARELLEKSLKFSFEETTHAILSSNRVYVPLISGYLSKGGDLAQQYKDGLVNVYILLSHAYLEEKDYETAMKVAEHVGNLKTDEEKYFYNLFVWAQLKQKNTRLNDSSLENLLDEQKNIFDLRAAKVEIQLY